MSGGQQCCGIDGDALIRARRRGRKAFERLVAHYRPLGVTDGEILRAMMDARGLISTLNLAGDGR
jgi:hypothetical protein